MLLAAVACTGDDAPSADDELRLDQIQVLGSHNSYHAGVPEDLLAVITSFDEATGNGLDYRHPPLREQLARHGARQLELDVFADPEGGLYADRRGLALVGRPIESGIAALDAPGFKVLHAADIDFDSTCLTLVACLEEVRAWSEDEPDHLPVMILIEAKQSKTPDPANLGFVQPPPFDAATFDALDAEIRSVFSPDELIVPGEVERAWPTVADARGKVLFALDNEDLAGVYSGDVLFTTEGRFAKLNDPIADGARIRQLVADGYLVRTRADADTVQARAKDTTMRDAALASGAHFVSTDYLVPDPRFPAYSVELPGGRTARCNPVTAPESCEDAQIKA